MGLILSGDGSVIISKCKIIHSNEIFYINK